MKRLEEQNGIAKERKKSQRNKHMPGDRLMYSLEFLRHGRIANDDDRFALLQYELPLRTLSEVEWRGNKRLHHTCKVCN